MSKRMKLLETSLLLAGPLQPAFRNWALTPPMGWNSWDCYGPTMTKAETRINADYMAQHLQASGWQYVAVHIRWYMGNDTAHGCNEQSPDFNLDQYGRFVPAPNRFPSAAGRQVLGVPPLRLPPGHHDRRCRGLPPRGVPRQAGIQPRR